MAKMSDGTEIYLFSIKKKSLCPLKQEILKSSLIQPIKECTMYFDHETFILANSIFQTPIKRSMGNKHVFLRKY